MNNLDYGIIGNCKSAALISQTGSIEWCCLPDFDSPSIFAKILDREKGGEFSIETSPVYTVSQYYKQNTNILVTKFQNKENEFHVIDFMPRYQGENGLYFNPPDLIRYIKYVSGCPRLRIKYQPQMNYAKNKTKTVKFNHCIKSYTENGEYESVYLYTDFDLDVILESREVELQSTRFLLISYNQKIFDPVLERIYLEYARTKVYWLDWINRTTSFLMYNDEIKRSALVLKLLSYQKSGAIIAAVTTSLPESLGETRNWDYRFCWIRDASMAISLLTKIGHYNTVKRFITFIIDVIPFKSDNIQIMYGIRGEKNLREQELPWLEGYEGSSPVRVGNAAYIQRQNDIYGILLDVIFKYFELYKTTIHNSEELWTVVRGIIRTVKSKWQDTDMGIWEFRSKEKHFVFSKVLCWTAIDRGIKIARIIGKDSYIDEWIPLRDKIKDDILEKGWNEKIGAFTQYYGGDELDASTLLMAFYGFIDYRDNKYIQTVYKTKELLLKNGLMYRYKHEDDFGLPTSSFTVCTFWLIKSLYKIGEKKEAKQLFDQLLLYSNPLGLFSEDIDFNSKRLLGNFPQGYSHLALIDTAITLSESTLDVENSLLQHLKDQADPLLEM